MSAIALPVLEQDIRAALARVSKGESLIVLDGDKEVAQIMPPAIQASEIAGSQSLVDFFWSSPLRNSGLVIDRDRSHERSGEEH